MSDLGQQGPDCRRCHGDGFPECMCHVGPVVDFTVPPARDLHDLARVADAVIDCGDPGQDPGDEDDHAGSQDRAVVLYALGAASAFEAARIGRAWDTDARAP